MNPYLQFGVVEHFLKDMSVWVLEHSIPADAN